MKGILIAAGGADWEADALRFLDADPGFALQRRCVDVADLVSTAQTGVAVAALVSLGLAGLDADIVHRLGRAHVRTIALDGDPERCRALGIDDRRDVGRLADLSASLPSVDPAVVEEPRTDGSGGLVAVWGPTGAPGRSTVALGLAEHWSRMGRRTILVDADPFGGAIAQMLGILDEVSGLLSAGRAANDGRVDELTDHVYAVADDLGVLTGLPRPDLWPRVRAGAVERILTRLRQDAEVSVLDAGFCIETPNTFDSAAPTRNQLTMQCLTGADHIIAVGRADPVGLTRLVRGLHDLDEAIPSARVSVLVNMTRGSIGWSEREIGATLERLTGRLPEAYLPLDQQAVDRAAISGRTVRAAQPDSRWAKAVERFAEQWSARHLDRVGV